MQIQRRRSEGQRKGRQTKRSQALGLWGTTVVGRDGVPSLGCPQESAGVGVQSPGESQKLWISQLCPDSVGGNWEQLEPSPGYRSERLEDTWLET